MLESETAADTRNSILERSVECRASASQHYLLNFALDIGLEHFSKIPSVYNWKYTVMFPDDMPEYFDKAFEPQRSATKMYPRKSLQDLIEVLLSTSFLSNT